MSQPHQPIPKLRPCNTGQSKLLENLHTTLLTYGLRQVSHIGHISERWALNALATQIQPTQSKKNAHGKGYKKNAHGKGYKEDTGEEVQKKLFKRQIQFVN